MDDGPEEAEGSYDYAGKTYRLVGVGSEKWRVFDGEDYLGAVIAVAGDDRSAYTIDFAGEERQYDELAGDDWRRVLEYLIDNTAPPVGA